MTLSKSYLALVILQLAACPVGARPVGATAPLVAQSTKTPPQIDGDLTDAAWSSAAVVNDFATPRSTEAATKAVTARFTFDDTYLYVAYECVEPTPARLRTRHRADHPEVWQDDSVELYVRTGGDHMAVDQLIVNAAGGRHSLRHRPGGGVAWPPDWPAAARVAEDRWTVELAVPLADIGIDAGRPGRLVEVKLGREDYTGAPMVLSMWPPGGDYGRFDDYGWLYLGEPNQLADPNQLAGHTGGGALVDTVALLAATPHRLSVRVRGAAPAYLEADGERHAERRRGDAPGWRALAHDFVSGADGRVSISVGAAGSLEVEDLRLVQVARLAVAGPAIPVAAGAGPVVITDVPIADSRVVRGFVGTPFDGTVHSLGWNSRVWEYPLPGGGAGVGYAYRNNDGLHVRLADADGFDAVQVRGGIRAELYGDGAAYDGPREASLIHTFRGRAAASRVLFAERVRSERVSFFEVSDGVLADVAFLRLGGDVPAGTTVASWRSGPRVEPDATVARRFAAAAVTHGLAASDSGEPLRLAAGQTVHLLAPPFEEETPLAALELVLRADREITPLRVAVQDPSDPRLELLGVDVEIVGDAPAHLVLDFIDQVAPRGARLWVTLTAGEPVVLGGAPGGGPELRLLGVEREVAVRQALPYRLFLLKSFFACASEPRPWTGLRRDTDVEAWFGTEPWGDQVRQVFESVAHARRLDPDDDTARQYDEWLWRGQRGRPAPEPVVADVPGAPAWAVWARAAWLAGRDVAAWWLEHRLVPTGELGGLVGDDSDLYQNFFDLPFYESDGVGARLIDAAARLAELAEERTLADGINRRTMDPLHAYEEGLNQEALMAAWRYGDPVYLERCMAAARSVAALTTVTDAGHRHFRSQDLGSEERDAVTVDRDGHAHPLMWHPAFEVLWYNRHPLIEGWLREWADGWLAHMEPGRYATMVDVATERVLETTRRPLNGGYGGLGSAFAFLAWCTGDQRYLQPFLETYAEGRDDTSPGQLLPELLHRYGRAVVLGGDPALAPSGLAATLLSGDKGPLVAALRQDVAELQRFPAMYTSSEPFTDRVFLYALSTATSAYTGGYARRNKYNRSHAVSWSGFGTGFAALVLEASPTRFRALLYSFHAADVTGEARFWSLDGGTYLLREGVDADADDEMDTATGERTVAVARGEPVAVRLVPGVVQVLELRQQAPTPSVLRADLALSPLDIRIGDGEVAGAAHNIGRVAAPCVVTLHDDAGVERRRAELGTIAAPEDLLPRRRAFGFDGLPEALDGWTLAVDTDAAVDEIYEGNNRLDLSGARNR